MLHWWCFCRGDRGREARAAGRLAGSANRCYSARMKYVLYAVLALAGIGDAARAGMQYHFQVGDHLRYEKRAAEGAADAAEIINIWCIEKSRDDVTLLVMVGDAGLERTEMRRAAVLKLDGAGRLSASPEVARAVAGDAAIFELLPPPPSSVDRPDAWMAGFGVFDQKWRIERMDRNAEANGTWYRFAVTDVRPAEDLPALSDELRFAFDESRGIVSQMIGRRRTNAGSSTIVASLLSAKRLPTEWIDRRAEEVRKYLNVLRSEQRIFDDLAGGATGAQMRDALNRLWSGFARDIDQRESPFAVLAEHRIDASRGDWPQIEHIERLSSRWLNRPAFPFSLTKFDGSAATSEALRNGVMVEFFWSADDIAAHDTLRQLNDRVARFAKIGVGVLCFNVDANDTAARSVISRCGGRLMHIHGEAVQFSEDLRAQPLAAIRVIDAKGIVRAMWIGWRPNLDEVLQSAEKLVNQGR